MKDPVPSTFDLVMLAIALVALAGLFAVIVYAVFFDEQVPWNSLLKPWPYQVVP